MKKIEVVKPFTYYINGYERRDFEIGEHEAPYDCAAYAERYGFAKSETKKAEVKKDAGADKSAGSKKASAG
jgi:hypothetical protein